MCQLHIILEKYKDGALLHKNCDIMLLWNDKKQVTFALPYSPFMTGGRVYRPPKDYQVSIKTHKTPSYFRSHQVTLQDHRIYEAVH